PRIGYGFDGGEVTDNKLEVRPKNGAAFPEVYFPKYGWLPVIGTPTKAKPTVGSDPATQRQDPNVLPSDDIQIGLFVPVLIPPKRDRKSTRLNSSHVKISYAVFC